MISQPTDQKQFSPFELLNEDYAKATYTFEDLLLRLQVVLNKLSDTNVPQELPKLSPTEPSLPFKDGRLMAFYVNNSRYLFLLDALKMEVTKAESLI